MSPQQFSLPAFSEAEVIRVNSRLKNFTLVTCIIIHGLLVYSLWGQWTRIAILTGAFMVVSGTNMVLAKGFFSQHTRTAEAARFIVNMLGTLFYGLISGWALPMWIYLPLNALWVDSFVDPASRRRLALMLVLVSGIALADGCPPLVPACVVLLSVLTYALSEGRVVLTHQTLQRLAQQHDELARAHQELAQAHEELARAHAQLDVAHQRAREQERLTSLGMLAAGVAHEINNPMSYVKSNVNALYLDLQANPQLTPELREYVDDVLPATLDGIRRVTAIVADLRRFARGDPEAMEEYDLNEEVAVALRIARGKLGPECDVALELGDVPHLWGHPGQVAQVVVNLLVNAAQAMPTGGRISVATRLEADEAVLAVRDTGTGMTPEVRSQLFQPFFTTKPAGEGTGMGLAVVHGIVTAHQGRIHVDTAPGQGSTFTVRLPRIPSLKLALSSPGEDTLPGRPVPSLPGKRRDAA